MAPQLSLNDSLVVDENVAYRELDGEGVILHLERGIYFGLNEVGARMWALIAEHGSLDTVLSALTAEYDAPRAEIARDLLALAADLSAKGLLRPRGQAR
jgi:coenzyme PQQ synthesis protein D (PqqD)